MIFTLGAIVLTALIAWLASRDNDRERPAYSNDDRNWAVLLHVRQDLKLVAFLLAGILVALGVVADRIG